MIGVSDSFWSMIRQRQWLLVAALLAAIWSGVAVVMRLTDHAISSPARVVSLMEEPAWSSPGDSRRSELLGEVIAKVNRLDFEQRAELRLEEPELMESFLENLTDDEKARYVNGTVAPRFEAIIKGLDAMPDEDRDRFIARLRKDFKERPPPGTPEELRMVDEETFGEVMDRDLRTAFRKASTEEKLRLAPMLEDIQRRLQGFGRR